MQQEIHIGPDEFKVEWFSGTGKGGQHRNKHQNCCRITHIPTGLRAIGTSSRERSINQRDAFRVLAARILAGFEQDRERPSLSERVRNYHAVRNEVRDEASGLRMSYTDVVEKCDIEPMIEARARTKRSVF